MDGYTENAGLLGRRTPLLQTIRNRPVQTSARSRRCAVAAGAEPASADYGQCGTDIAFHEFGVLGSCVEYLGMAKGVSGDLPVKMVGGVPCFWCVKGLTYEDALP